MSVHLTAAAWKLPLPPGEKLYLLALCDFANDDGICWPSQRTLAERTGNGERWVRKMQARLERRGLVQRVSTSHRPSEKTKAGRSNTYRLCFRGLAPLSDNGKNRSGSTGSHVPVQPEWAFRFNRNTRSADPSSDPSLIHQGIVTRDRRR